MQGRGGLLLFPKSNRKPLFVSGEVGIIMNRASFLKDYTDCIVEKGLMGSKS